MNHQGKRLEEHRRRFEDIVRSDPDLVRLLTAARDLNLPQWRVVAGCLYQTVWNVLTNKPQGTGINDYDLIYFHDTDLSWEAEDQIVKLVSTRMSDFAAPVEVRNQARVHLWFKQRFGADYAPLGSADEALTRYSAVVHALGVRLEVDGRFDVVAPFGFDDLFAMVIRPNKALQNRGSYAAKAARAKAIWTEVVVIPWGE